MTKRTIEDIRPEVHNEMNELEKRVNSVSKMFDSCNVNSNEFIDNMGKIGGLHWKYTKANYLPESSEAGKKFDGIMNKFGKARHNFVTNCECSKK